MRILFASTGGAGHFSPLLPWVEASVRRGHDVLVVGPAELAAVAARSGVPMRVGASPTREQVAPIWAQVATLKHEDAGPVVVGELFCRLNSGALLPAVRAVCDEWTPDLVLRDPTEFASAVAAEECGIRHVRIAHGLAAGEEGALRFAARPLQSFRPGVDRRIAESSYLTMFPEGLDPSPFSDTRRYRLPPHGAGEHGAPARRTSSADPLIYITFGTVAPAMPGMASLFRAAMESVAGLPVRAILSVGRDLDITQLDRPPTNVQIRSWVDHDVVMAEAAVVVCHGGAGTTLDALAAGVPLVVFPLFADQADNARCVVSAGAGVAVEAYGNAAANRAIESTDAAALREAILDVLDHRGYAEAAATARSAFTALSLLDDVYEQLLTDRTPS